jgi:hypothetical protein
MHDGLFFSTIQVVGISLEKQARIYRLSRRPFSRTIEPNRQPYQVDALVLFLLDNTNECA